MNNKIPTNLDLDALRAFVKGIELGSFHLAAQYLCRSPAAISAQLKKLEQQTQCQLLKKQGRLLEMTPNGKLLYEVAQEIFQKNDHVLIQLKKTLENGEIYFGLQEDFSDSVLQGVIAQFMQQFPNVKLFTQVGRNANIISDIEKSNLDLALIWQQNNLENQFSSLGSVQTVWVKHQKFNLDKYLNQKESIPLIVLNQPCMLRQFAINTLNQHKIAWHICYECNSLNALWAAVRVGMGITLRSDFYIPHDLEKNSTRLPKLSNTQFGIYKSSKIPTSIHEYFEKCITENLNSVIK